MVCIAMDMIRNIRPDPVQLLIASVLQFAVGALWFGPLFGKRYEERMNNDKGVTNSMGWMARAYKMGTCFGGSAVATIIRSVIAAYFFHLLSLTSCCGVAQFATGMAAVELMSAITWLWAQQDPQVFAITTLYNAVQWFVAAYALFTLKTFW